MIWIFIKEFSEFGAEDTAANWVVHVGAYSKAFCVSDREAFRSPQHVNL